MDGVVWREGGMGEGWRGIRWKSNENKRNDGKGEIYLDLVFVLCV